MEKHEIEKLKEKLLEEKKKIEVELSGIATKDPNAEGEWDPKFPSFGDHKSEQDENSDEVEEYVATVSIEENLEDRVHDINTALEKIEKGEYGKCEKCDKEIPLERLQVNPEAKTCVDCAA